MHNIIYFLRFTAKIMTPAKAAMAKIPKGIPTPSPIAKDLLTCVEVSTENIKGHINNLFSIS